MHQPKKKPDPAKVSGFRQSNSTPGNFATVATIRRRFGTGIHGYEAAKSAWHAEYPGAEPRQIERAMRRIAKAVGV